MRFPLPTVLRHYAQGLLMGGADVIPGVSGGTMALIVGIYERLVGALSSAYSAVLALLRLDLAAVRQHVREVDVWFVGSVLAGIGTAILVASTFIPGLLETYPAQMRGLFFGLVAASIAVPLLRLGRVTPRLGLIMLAAAVTAYVLVGLPSVESSEPTLLRVFGTAAFAICAMILPGVSGAFLLEVLGLYAPTLEALHQRDVAYVLVFMAGAATGLGLFAKLLDYLLSRHHDPTMAALVGLMAGSLRAIWPWLADDRSLQWPGPADPVAGVVLLGIAGFAFVAALTWWGRRRLQEDTAGPA